MRVTGGEARGRILKVPDTGTVRPTTDKMRQQLYNMLAHSPWAVRAGFVLPDALVLDGFCGTGALGIEALSRGAAHCVFVERDRTVMDFARDNVKLCQYEAKSVFINKDCQAIGQRPETILPRQLCMLDPPYRKGLVEPAIAALFEGKWLAPHALIVAETEKGWDGIVPDVLQKVLVRTDGDSQLNVWYQAA